jgi:type VI secretion system protein
MDTISLYDLLVGCFVFRGDDPGEVDPEMYFERMTEDEKLRSSIVENIKMILQSRRGSITHLPDFGLPDIRQIYFDEGSIDSVPNMIKETILKYEPRLQDVRVRRKNFDPNNLRLSLEIDAKIRDLRGKELLLTEFSSTGWLKVVFDRDVKIEPSQEEAE